MFVFALFGKAHAFMEYFPAVKAGGEYKKQKFDNAATDYNKALEYKPNWQDASFNLGNTYFRQKNIMKLKQNITKLQKQEQNL